MANVLSNLIALIFIFIVSWMVTEFIEMKVMKFRAMKKVYRQLKDAGLSDEGIKSVIASIKVQ